MSLREPLTPLAPDIADLLAAEGRSVELSAAERAHLLSRIASTVGGFPPVDGGESNPPGDPAAPAPSGLVRGLTAHPARLALATFIVGGILGAAIDHAATRARPSDPPPQTSLAPVSPAPPVATVESPTTSVTHLPDAPSSASAPSPRAPAAIDPITKDTALAAERTLIDTAKTALGRRDDAAALETLDRHARTYPRGELSEEREALKVQALVGAKRVAEARGCAERFKKTYPRSMLMPVVDDALQKP